MQKTILVTGAGGYIGSCLVDQLLKAGYKVKGIDRYFFGKELLGSTLRNPNFKLVQKDIRDLNVEDLSDVNVVFDLASLSNDPCGDLDEELTHSINYLGRVHAATVAKEAGVRQYVLASSCSVYGSGVNAALTEESETRPVSAYARANILAEQGVLPLASDNFVVTILRQATVFGLSKRMRFDLAINIMTLNAVQKGKIFVMGGGAQWRPFVHVTDAARIFVQLAEEKPTGINGEIFNVGSNRDNYNILALSYIVRESIPFPVEVIVLPDDTDKRNYHVSFDKIAKVLNFCPEYTPTDGVKEIYEALKLGQVDTGKKTVTVEWYKHIVEAKNLVNSLMIGDKLL